MHIIHGGHQLVGLAADPVGNGAVVQADPLGNGAVVQAYPLGNGAVSEVTQQPIDTPRSLNRDCTRQLARKLSNISIDESEVVFEHPVSSSDNDVELETPMSSSSDDSDFKKFVMSKAEGKPTSSCNLMNTTLLNHALAIAVKPLRARANKTGKAKGKAKPKAKSGKRRKVAAAQTHSTFVGVTMHLGDTKSYIKSKDETGVARCRWHLTPTTNPRHKQLTELMALAMKSTRVFGLPEVHSILTSIKEGLATEEAIAMIGRVGLDDAQCSDVDDEDDDEGASNVDDSSDVADSSGDSV